VFLIQTLTKNIILPRRKNSFSIKHNQLTSDMQKQKTHQLQLSTRKLNIMSKIDVNLLYTLLPLV